MGKKRAGFALFYAVASFPRNHRMLSPASSLDFKRTRNFISILFRRTLSLLIGQMDNSMLLRIISFLDGAKNFNVY